MIFADKHPNFTSIYDAMLTTSRTFVSSSNACTEVSPPQSGAGMFVMSWTCGNWGRFINMSTLSTPDWDTEVWLVRTVSVRINANAEKDCRKSGM